MKELELVRIVLHRLNDTSYSYSEGGVGGTCYQCPFATEPLDMLGNIAHDVWNDPTEAYFKCSLPGRNNEEVFWGEYAPCIESEWADAALEALTEYEQNKKKLEEAFLAALKEYGIPVEV